MLSKCSSKVSSVNWDDCTTFQKTSTLKSSQHIVEVCKLLLPTPLATVTAFPHNGGLGRFRCGDVVTLCWGLDFFGGDDGGPRGRPR